MGVHVSYRDLDGEAAGVQYSLTLKNESLQPWTFYVYQRMPTQPDSVFSLAWLVSPSMVPVGGQVTFGWEVAYDFVWAETGPLSPGMVFTAAQVIAADPLGANTTTFSVSPAPGFSSPVPVPPAGSLAINDVASVPLGLYSVGIGMAGIGTLVAQAYPNLRYQFAAETSYWIAAGTNVRTGTVLGLPIANSAQVQFPPGVSSVTRTLDEALKWESEGS
jgi:rhizosphere induced protein